MNLTEYELKLLKEQINESNNAVSDEFLVATDNLRKDIHEFYKLFGDLRKKNCPSVFEKVREGIEERSKEPLTDLRECSSRIQGDVNTIKEFINNKSLKLNCIDDANENIFELSSICNSVFKRFNVFPKKEIPLLKDNLRILVDAIKELDDLIFKYNDNKTELLLLQPSLKFDLIKKFIDSKIDNQIEELLGLFQKLNHSINEYIFACKAYKTALKTSLESEGNTEEDAERKMHSVFDEKKKILAEINKFFDDEPREFSPVSEEIKNKIDEEYMELINSMEFIKHSMQITSNQKIPKILEMQGNLIKEFDELENKITEYNHKAEAKRLEFRFIAPEDAHNNYEEISKKINDNWERNFQNRKNKGLVYQKP